MRQRSIAAGLVADKYIGRDGGPPEREKPPIPARATYGHMTSSEYVDAVLALAAFVFSQNPTALWGGVRGKEARAALSSLTRIPEETLESIVEGR